MSAALKWNGVAALEGARDRRPAEREPVLGHLALDHRDGPAGKVVVVEARVVVVHPADQPDRDVVVAAQLLVVALVRRVLHEVLPHRGIGGQVTDEGLQGGAVELTHSEALRVGDGRGRARPRRRAPRAATGSTTGRSEP